MTPYQIHATHAMDARLMLADDPENEILKHAVTYHELQAARLKRMEDMKSNIIDIDGAIEHRTEKAIFFHTGNKEEAAWLPLSMIEVEETGIGGIYTVTLPESLALDKGLI